MTPIIRAVFFGLALVAALSGCAIGGQAPGYVSCKGKGVITGSGAVGAGLGGGNVFTLNVDCGDGVEFSQGAPAAR